MKISELDILSLITSRNLCGGFRYRSMLESDKLDPHFYDFGLNQGTKDILKQKYSSLYIFYLENKDSYSTETLVKEYRNKFSSIEIDINDLF